MNIFEGSRRVAIIFGILITIGSLFGIYQSKPYVTINYKIPFLGWEPIRENASFACRIGIDAWQTRQLQTANGNPYTLSFCFIASSAENGALLVPFKASGDNVIMNSPYSDDVTNYANNIISQEKTRKIDDLDADDDFANQRRHSWFVGLAFLAAGLAIYWGLVCAVGWVVRGFMGIPRGQDRRHPAPEQEAAPAQ